MGTPIPNKTHEAKGTGAGPVTEYRLSDEELNRMREKDGPACGLTRQALLEAVAQGESLSSIERAWGMKYNTIHVWTKKWDLKGITPDKARELLTESAEPAKEPVSPAEQPEPAAQEPSGDTENSDAKPETAGILREKHLESRESAAVEMSRVKDLEIAQLRQALQESEAANQSAAETYRSMQVRMKERIDDLEWQLEQERQMTEQMSALMQEDAEALAQPANDPVNHPAHYTAGSIECIDAISAALTGLSGEEAYCTGAAIKYLWRWKHKNGPEDLEKARWYINRLLGAK